MNVTECPGMYYQLCYTGSDVLDSLEQKFDLKFNRKYYLPKTLNKLKKNLRNKIPIQQMKIQKNERFALILAKIAHFHFLKLSKTGLHQKSLRPHSMSDFSVRRVFYSPFKGSHCSHHQYSFHSILKHNSFLFESEHLSLEFFTQKEIRNMHTLNAFIITSGKFVHSKNVFWIVIFNFK